MSGERLNTFLRDIYPPTGAGCDAVGFNKRSGSIPRVHYKFLNVGGELPLNVFAVSDSPLLPGRPLLNYTP